MFVLLSCHLSSLQEVGVVEEVLLVLLSQVVLHGVEQRALEVHKKLTR